MAQGHWILLAEPIWCDHSHRMVSWYLQVLKELLPPLLVAKTVRPNPTSYWLSSEMRRHFATIVVYHGGTTKDALGFCHGVGVQKPSSHSSRAARSSASALSVKPAALARANHG